MPQYYDSIQLDNLDIDASTVIYVVNHFEGSSEHSYQGSLYRISGASCNLSAFQHCPQTYKTKYWEIDVETLLAVFNDENIGPIFFEDNNLTTRPISYQSLKDYLGCDPAITPEKNFGVAPANDENEQSDRDSFITYSGMSSSDEDEQFDRDSFIAYSGMFSSHRPYVPPPQENRSIINFNSWEKISDTWVHGHDETPFYDENHSNRELEFINTISQNISKIYISSYTNGEYRLFVYTGPDGYHIPLNETPDALADREGRIHRFSQALVASGIEVEHDNVEEFPTTSVVNSGVLVLKGSLGEISNLIEPVINAVNQVEDNVNRISDGMREHIEQKLQNTQAYQQRP